MPPARHIIHLDMDCFYAAIEMRDDPSLRGKPVGVGGSSRRGVLTTANYEARRFGCHSAMPVHEALRLCPELILCPTRFPVYRAESAKIRALMHSFTPQVEPLSLDEAYLDVSHRSESPAEIARHLRRLIFEDLQLTASAGIGPNKLVAKIASDLDKPDGQVEVGADEVEEFMAPLSVRRIWGVGPKTARRLGRLGIETCAQLRDFDRDLLIEHFGAYGLELRAKARGQDERPVKAERERKSCSVESTFAHNLESVPELETRLDLLYPELEDDLAKHAERQIAAVVIKLKFADFSSTTAEQASNALDRGLASQLLVEARSRKPDQPVRLLGIGVRFASGPGTRQLELL